MLEDKRKKRKKEQHKKEQNKNKKEKSKTKSCFEKDEEALATLGFGYFHEWCRFCQKRFDRMRRYNLYAKHSSGTGRTKDKRSQKERRETEREKEKTNHGILAYKHL